MKNTLKSKGIDLPMLSRLRAAGCPMPLENEDVPIRDVTIEISETEFTKAYDSRSGSEYIFAVRITNHSFARVEIQKFQCVLYWSTQLQWLLCQDGLDEYRLPSGRKFRSHAVLNHRTGASGAIDPGNTLDGFLLAFSAQQIPEEYLHSFRVPVTLAVVDQFDRKHISEIELEVDRSATQKPLRQLKRRSSLFDPVESPDESHAQNPEPESNSAEASAVVEFNKLIDGKPEK